MAMYRCDCGEWISSTKNHKCKPYPFNVMRGMTKEEAEVYKESLNKLFKPTGKNLFDE